jgi:vesicle coat complex subunit
LEKTMASTAAWTIVHRDDASTDHSNDLPALRNALEKGNEDTKLQTMQKILIIMLNGDPLPGLLMHVIRFVGAPDPDLCVFFSFLWVRVRIGADCR